MKLLQLLALLGICSLATAGADTFTVINSTGEIEPNRSPADVGAIYLDP